MILVDESVGSRELFQPLQALGVKPQLTALPYGDVCFEGNGPEGPIGVGIERKRIGDMLQCIQDGRYNGHQRLGMAKMYEVSILLIEGLWRPGDGGILQEGQPAGKGRMWWASQRPGGKVMYHTLRRYLFSVALSGVQVIYTSDLRHTAYDVAEWFHYWQKPWDKHTALMTPHRGQPWQQGARVLIPALTRKPSLVARMAAELDGIGVNRAQDVARAFKTVEHMVLAEVEEWEAIPGIGKGTAQKVVKTLRGTL